MSQENVEVVRATVTMFNRSGFLPEKLFDPEIELFKIRESPLPGPYRGYAGLLEWRQGVFEVIDEGRFEIDDVIDVDESDLVIYKNRLLGRARHTGIEIDISWTNLNWFREGRIYRSESFTSHAEALKAAGLEGQAMSRANVEIAKRGVDAFNRRDVDGWADLITSDFEHYPAIDRPVEGGLYGLDGTYQGATGFERAEAQRRRLQAANLQASVRQEWATAGPYDSAL